MSEANCRFYGSMKGCRFVNNCRFSHNNPNSISLCRYYQTNTCQKGHNCLFRHYTNKYNRTKMQKQTKELKKIKKKKPIHEWKYDSIWRERFHQETISLYKINITMDLIDLIASFLLITDQISKLLEFDDKNHISISGGQSSGCTWNATLKHDGSGSYSSEYREIHDEGYPRNNTDWVTGQWEVVEITQKYVRINIQGIGGYDHDTFGDHGNKSNIKMSESFEVYI
eukprot:323916_1